LAFALFTLAAATLCCYGLYAAVAFFLRELQQL
jgi:hypothetical protein